MGHQFSFLVQPAEVAFLETAIRKNDEVAFLTDRTSEAKPIEHATLPVPSENRRFIRVYLVRADRLDEVDMRFIEQQSYWMIRTDESNAIELDLGLGSDALVGGRFCFASDLRFRKALPEAEFREVGRSFDVKGEKGR